jgi:hypothetical protein
MRRGGVRSGRQTTRTHLVGTNDAHELVLLEERFDRFDAEAARVPAAEAGPEAVRVEAHAAAEVLLPGAHTGEEFRFVRGGIGPNQVGGEASGHKCLM